MAFGKRNRLHSAETERRRINVEKLLLLLLCGGKRFLGGLRLGGALLEFVHATGGVHELLLSGVERVAHVANTDDDHRLGGAGLDLIATGATDFRVHIFRMNVRLHKKGGKLTTNGPDDKREFAGISPRPSEELFRLQWICFNGSIARRKLCVYFGRIFLRANPISLVKIDYE